MTVTDHLAQSLKSNDLAHFTDFYPRRSCNVRPTNGVNALISMSCRKSGRWWVRRRRRRVVLSHPAPRTFDEEDSGLLVPLHQSARVKSSHSTRWGDNDSSKDYKITKTILFLLDLLIRQTPNQFCDYLSWQK